MEKNKDDGYLTNRLLLAALKEDADRAALFDQINRDGGTFDFPSRDSGQRDDDGWGLETPRPPPMIGHRAVRLVTRRALIEEILRDDGSKYSNRVYAELGGGSFMLALDPKASGAHKAQREAYFASFPHVQDDLVELAHLSCEAAAIMGLRSPDFDLATFAEQTAVRFCQKLLGYAFTDYPRLESHLRSAYGGLVYQVLGRHFVTDPTAVPMAKQAMAQLLARTNVLIDAYQADDEDVLKQCKDTALPKGFEPVMKKLAHLASPLNGEQRAVLALGAVVGTVGNVQAAACIAVQYLFAGKERERLKQARALARKDDEDGPTRHFDDWKEFIQAALRENPPIPFLPRLEICPDGTVREVLLALGGGTRDDPRPGDDPLVWGLPQAAPHWCAGQALAWPLVVAIVRQVMRLPGLSQRLDPEDATVIGLKKRWGFACESYPLTHQRERRMAQSSLNVAMRLKSPVRENADRVREVIRSGAPRIEEALKSARHVHFAWFELIEADSVLVLHTVYDGPFSAYIQHFALKVGTLFDALFECIENPPPMPVDKFPNDFVAHIQRYNRAPAAGYFFSAYPDCDVAHILRDALGRP